MKPVNEVYFKQEFPKVSGVKIIGRDIGLLYEIVYCDGVQTLTVIGSNLIECLILLQKDLELKIN